MAHSRAARALAYSASRSPSAVLPLGRCALRAGGGAREGRRQYAAALPAIGPRLAARLQPLQRVLADRLQHAEARRAGRARRLPQQAAGSARDAAAPSSRRPGRQPLAVRRAGRRPRRLPSAAAGEDGQPPEERLLRSVEQVVAPGDGVAQRLLAGRQVARAAGQQRQPRAPAAPAAPAAGAAVTRAAASSIASGSPSSRRQISATAGGVRRRSGRSPARTACARSTNSATAASGQRVPARRRGRAGQRQRRHRDTPARRESAAARGW